METPLSRECPQSNFLNIRLYKHVNELCGLKSFIWYMIGYRLTKRNSYDFRGDILSLPRHSCMSGQSLIHMLALLEDNI